MKDIINDSLNQHVNLLIAKHNGGVQRRRQQAQQDTTELDCSQEISQMISEGSPINNPQYDPEVIKD